MTVITSGRNLLQGVNKFKLFGNLKIDVARGEAGETIYRVQSLFRGQSITSKSLQQAWIAGFSVIAVLRLYLREWRNLPDLVIATVPALPSALLGFFAAAVLRTPYVLDLRDAWPELLDERDEWNRATNTRSLRERILSKGPAQTLIALVRVALSFVIRNASGIMVTSDNHKKWLIENRGIPEPNICVVRNVFPPAQVRQMGKGAETPGKLNVLYAGTVGRAQNLSTAIEAAVLCHNRGVDLKLRIIGDGAAWDQAKHLSESYPFIEVEPSRSPQDLFREYEWADTALVQLTDWPALKLAMPSKTFELMANGIHITAVANGELANLVESLEAGVTVKPEDPQQLADVWGDLALNPELLRVGTVASGWVTKERNVVVPKKFVPFLSRIVEQRSSNESQ